VATLAGGRVEDASLLLRRGAVRAEVRVLGPGERVEPAGGAGHLVVHVVSGTLRARGPGGAAQAGARETLWWRDPPAGLRLDPDAGATALLLRLAPPG